MNKTEASEVKIPIGDKAIDNLISKLSREHQVHAREALRNALTGPLLTVVNRPGNGFDYEASWKCRDIESDDSYAVNRLWLGTIKVIAEVRRGIYTEV